MTENHMICRRGWIGWELVADALTAVRSGAQKSLVKGRRRALHDSSLTPHAIGPVMQNLWW